MMNLVKKITRINPAVLALFVLVVAFSVLYPDKFLSQVNISSILRQFIRITLFAVGPTFVVLTGSLDLSYVGIWMLGGILLWYLHPVAGAISMVIYPVLGLFTGLLVGIIQTKAKVPSFILTLSLTVSYWGLTAWLSGGYPRVVRGYEWIIPRLVPFIPTALFWTLPILLAAVFIARRTKVGTYLYAIGSNEEGAKLAGIEVTKYKISAFVLSGLFTGIGLVVLFPFMGSSVPTDLKLGNIVDPLVAIVLGGTTLVGGSGGPERTALGALIYAVVSRGLALTFWHPEILQLLLGLLILASILVSTRGLKGVTIT